MGLKVGIQLYSVRDEMQKDPITTIKTACEIGYRYLEVANHTADQDPGVGFGVPADKLKEILAECNASVVSGHIHPFNEETAAAVIEYHKSIGNKYIIKAMDFFADEADVIAKAAEYNKMGKLCHENGMMFLYHNHFHEFKEYNGETILDIIAKNTDPNYVGFELDTFWCMRGGHDPVTVMKKLGNRIKLIHQKDFNKASTSPVNVLEAIGDAPLDFNAFVKYVNPTDFVEIGTGSMDIQSIINTAIELGCIEYVILEQDQTTYNQIESIKISMENLKKYTGIEC